MKKEIVKKIENIKHQLGIKIKMSKQVEKELLMRVKFYKYSQKEKEIWLEGYECAVEYTKKLSWYIRLFNNYK